MITSLFRKSLCAMSAAFAGLAALSSNSSAQGTAFCFGDGSGASCPCSNFGFPGGGCSNSSFPGSILSSQGTASLSADTVLVRGTLLPFDPTGAAVLFQGTTQMSGGAGSALGAGLLCIGGPVRRLGTKSLASGLFELGPAAGDAALSAIGQVTTPGTVMHYQLWYRDTLVGCSQPNFNLSNGLSITWIP